MRNSDLNIQEIPIEFLRPGRYQTRVDFNPDELAELAASISKNGLVQPIVVRRGVEENQFEIVAGERRWRASQMAGLERITCVIKDYSEQDAASVTAIENVIRVDLNPIEEAQAYKKLIDEFAFSHEQIAAAVGKSRTKISNLLRLTALDSRIQSAIKDGDLTEGHGKLLVGVSDLEQWGLAQQAVRSGLSVRQLERLIQQKRKAVGQVAKAKACHDTEQLAAQLSDYLGCPVTIEKNNSSLQMSVQCFDLEILDGVLQRIGFNAANADDVDSSECD